MTRPGFNVPGKKKIHQLQNYICKKREDNYKQVTCSATSCVQEPTFLNWDPILFVTKPNHNSGTWLNSQEKAKLFELHYNNGSCYYYYLFSLIQSTKTNGILQRKTCPAWVDSKTYGTIMGLQQMELKDMPFKKLFAIWGISLDNI